MMHSSWAKVSKGSLSCRWAQFVHSNCASLRFYVTGHESTSAKDSACVSLLSAPPAAALLHPSLSSRCILRIETSFKMACWDQFSGHRQEDSGIKEVRRATGVSPPNTSILSAACSSVQQFSTCSSCSVCGCGYVCTRIWLVAYRVAKYQQS